MNVEWDKRSVSDAKALTVFVMTLKMANVSSTQREATCLNEIVAKSKADVPEGALSLGSCFEFMERVLLAGWSSDYHLCR